MYLNGLQLVLKVEGNDDCKDKYGNLQHFFYADDLQIYLRVSIDQLASGAAALTRVANGIYECAGADALKLNASKNKAMICGSRDFVRRIPPDLPHNEVSCIPVPYVETAENLGVSLDP